eukprot:COSAG02_NODE_1281_length_13472_cov_8.763048_8_plen_94_part_00
MEQGGGKSHLSSIVSASSFEMELGGGKSHLSSIVSAPCRRRRRTPPRRDARQGGRDGRVDGAYFRANPSRAVRPRAAARVPRTTSILTDADEF